jgi:hypothetical protein
MLETFMVSPEHGVMPGPSATAAVELFIFRPALRSQKSAAKTREPEMVSVSPRQLLIPNSKELEDGNTFPLWHSNQGCEATAHRKL